MHRSPGITASALLALSLSACGGQAESITESVTATTTRIATITSTPSSASETTIPEPESINTQSDPVEVADTPPTTLPGGARFDPHSGDGYGPEQELPPLCVRFPNDYKCDGGPIAPTVQDQSWPDNDPIAPLMDCFAAGGTEETCGHLRPEGLTGTAVD